MMKKMTVGMLLITAALLCTTGCSQVKKYASVNSAPDSTLSLSTSTASVTTAPVETPTPTPTPTQEPTPEPQTGKTIGTPIEGESVIVIALKNGTGRTISEFQVKDQDTDDYTDNMLADPWQPEEIRTFYLDAANYRDGVKWNVRVAYPEGDKSSITSCPLTEMTDGTFIIADDGLLYVAYVSTSTGEWTDTLENERSYRNPDHQEPAQEAEDGE